MSSTRPMFLRSLKRYLMAATKSGVSSVRLSSGVSSPILMLNFRRPMRLKSYLRGSKNMPRKRLVAVSSVGGSPRSEEQTSELQSQSNLVCRLLLEKKILKDSAKAFDFRTYVVYNVNLN